VLLTFARRSGGRLNGALRQLHPCDEAARVERKACLHVNGDLTGEAATRKELTCQTQLSKNSRTATRTVTLLWDPRSNQVSIEVVDHLDGSEFRLPVAGHAALDAFHHPYAFGRPYEETPTASHRRHRRTDRLRLALSKGRFSRRSSAGSRRYRPRRRLPQAAGPLKRMKGPGQVARARRVLFRVR
jgi:hypothetical protein